MSEGLVAITSSRLNAKGQRGPVLVSAPVRVLHDSARCRAGIAVLPLLVTSCRALPWASMPKTSGVSPFARATRFRSPWD